MDETRAYKTSRSRSAAEVVEVNEWVGGFHGLS